MTLPLTVSHVHCQSDLLPMTQSHIDTLVTCTRAKNWSYVCHETISAWICISIRVRPTACGPISNQSAIYMFTCKAGVRPTAKRPVLNESTCSAYVYKPSVTYTYRLKISLEQPQVSFVAGGKHQWNLPLDLWWSVYWWSVEVTLIKECFDKVFFPDQVQKWLLMKRAYPWTSDEVYLRFSVFLKTITEENKVRT